MQNEEDKKVFKTSIIFETIVNMKDFFKLINLFVVLVVLRLIKPLLLLQLLKVVFLDSLHHFKQRFYVFVFLFAVEVVLGNAVKEILIEDFVCFICLES